MSTVGKKPVKLFLLYLKNFKLRLNLKLLDCCTLQVFFKSQNKLSKNYSVTKPIAQVFVSGVFSYIKLQCGLCN